VKDLAILEGRPHADQHRDGCSLPKVCWTRTTVMILPPLTMDLGLLMISIGAVNLWRARQKST
jgi:hypothetical protein